MPILQAYTFTMAEELATDGWIVTVECPVAGTTKYLAGFDTPREAMLAVRERYDRGTMRFKGCLRLTANDLRAIRLQRHELRPFQ